MEILLIINLVLTGSILLCLFGFLVLGAIGQKAQSKVDKNNGSIFLGDNDANKLSN